MFRYLLVLFIGWTVMFTSTPHLNVGAQNIQLDSNDFSQRTTSLTGRILSFVYCAKDDQGVYDELKKEFVIQVSDKDLSENIIITNGKSEEFEAFTGSEVRLEGNFLVNKGEDSKRFSYTKITRINSPLGDVSEALDYHTKRIAIVAFEFLDTTATLPNPQSFRDPVVNNNRNLKSYLHETLRGRMTINNDVVDVYGWYTVPYPTLGCTENNFNWTSSARQQAAAESQSRGVANFDQYYSHVFFIAPATDCPFVGLASAGMGPSSPFQLSVMYPMAAYTSSDQLSLLAHEMGHTLGGWNHPSKSNCFGPTGNGCVRQNNGGTYSPMGVPRVIHYSPVEKIIMGGVDPIQMQNLGTFNPGSVSVVLHPHEWSIKGLQVATGLIPGTNENVVVMVNSTSRSGYNLTGGSITDVYVLLGTSPGMTSQQLFLVDVTPNTPDDWYDAALKSGSSITHTTVPFTVTNDGPSVDNHGRGVRVTFRYNP